MVIELLSLSVVVVVSIYLVVLPTFFIECSTSLYGRKEFCDPNTISAGTDVVTFNFSASVLLLLFNKQNQSTAGCPRDNFCFYLQKEVISCSLR